jgi:hypothetical protein
MFSQREVTRRTTHYSYAARFACGEEISLDPYGREADAEVLRRMRETVGAGVVGLRHENGLWFDCALESQTDSGQQLRRPRRFLPEAR